MSINVLQLAVPSDKNVSEDKADTPKPEDSAVKFEEPSDKDQGEKKSSETKEDVANVIIAPPSQDGLTKSDENTDLTKPIGECYWKYPPTVILFNSWTRISAQKS